MKRTAHPSLMRPAQEALASYEHWLREREDLAAASIRNYLSDLRHFIAWYETQQGAHGHNFFTPQEITTPALTRYRIHLQTVQRQKPASVYRSFICLKCSFGWVFQQHLISYSPDAVYLFPPSRVKNALSERALGYIVKICAGSFAPRCQSSRFAVPLWLSHGGVRPAPQIGPDHGAWLTGYHQTLHSRVLRHLLGYRM